MFSNTRFVSARASPSSSCPVCGLIGPCPDTKMKSPSTIAWEYGPTGFGPFSVTMAFLTSSSSIVDTNDDFSDRVAGLHVGDGLGRGFPREDPVQDRLDDTLFHQRSYSL